MAAPIHAQTHARYSLQPPISHRKTSVFDTFRPLPIDYNLKPSDFARDTLLITIYRGWWAELLSLSLGRDKASIIAAGAASHASPDCSLLVHIGPHREQS